MRKNVLSFIAAYTAMFVAVLVLACSYCSCNSKNPIFPASDEQTEMEVIDSLVNMHVQEIVNPVFSSVDECLVYKDLDDETRKYADVFSSMPEKTVAEVCKVLINREKVASKKAIVMEYLAHPDIYPYLQSPDTLPSNKEQKKPLIELTKESSTTVTEAPQTRVADSKTSKISIKDTTIDGKKAVVTTRIDYE